MLEILGFAAAYSVKGGWLSKFDFWNNLTKKFEWIDKIDGKVLSTILVLLTGIICFPQVAGLIAICWLIGIAPSMGEEAGGTGRYGKAWGPYINHFDREFAIKKSVIRGVFTTAPMAVVMSNPWLLLAGASFPVVYYVFQTIYYWIYKKDSWALAEPAYGAIIGAAFLL